eukprot:1122860_1
MRVRIYTAPSDLLILPHRPPLVECKTPSFSRQMLLLPLSLLFPLSLRMVLLKVNPRKKSIQTSSTVKVISFKALLEKPPPLELPPSESNPAPEQMNAGINPATDAAYVHSTADRFRAGDNDDGVFAAIVGNSSLTSCAQRVVLQFLHNLRNAWFISALLFVVLAIGVGCFVRYSSSPVLEITGSGLSVTDRAWIQSQCANAADLDRLANLVQTNTESGSDTTDYDNDLRKLSQAWAEKKAEIQKRTDKVYTELKENYRTEVDSLKSTIKDLRDKTVQNVDSLRNDFGKYVDTYSGSMNDRHAQIAQLSKMSQQIQTNSERDKSFDDYIQKMELQYSDMEDIIQDMKKHTVNWNGILMDIDSMTRSDVLNVILDFHKKNSPENAPVDRAYIRKVVHEFYEGENPEVDYALKSNGASVYFVQHDFSNNVMLDFVFPPPRDTTITPVTTSGVCHALKGKDGRLMIKLRTYISPTRIMYEHALNTPITKSMPRYFKVYGISEKDKSQQMIPLSPDVFEYDRKIIDYEHIQGFDLKLPSSAPKDGINVIVIDVFENYGLRAYTCLYRFRVYGTPCETC